MSIGVYMIDSKNADSENINRFNDEYLKQLAEKTGLEIVKTGLESLDKHELSLVFIGGGGVEGRFVKIEKGLPQPVYLLSTGFNNSLAASMEILSYLKQNGKKGEILHGSLDDVAERLKALYTVNKARKRISEMRLARVGQPSDWLISSDVDAEQCKKKTGITIIDISMEEFLEEIRKHQYEKNKYTEMIRAKKWHEKDTLLCCYVYGALRRLVEKYDLDGVTVRCFDLLDTVKATGCLALAVLNAEGIYASCEGDLPALISMCVLGELTNEPVFMANPSRILTDSNEMIFAHCTLPINMPDSFECMTHFESGIGVAFRGKIREGDTTVFKTNGLMDSYFAAYVQLTENLNEPSLCRTQIKLKMDKEDLKYFLKDSIGNHHLIVKGNHKAIIDEFFK